MNSEEANKTIDISKLSQSLKEFRINVLRLCYVLSEGNSWNWIKLRDLVEKLGIEDSSDMKLSGAIRYLSDKEFLDQPTSVGVQITASGIEEVERKFPSFVEEREGEFYIPTGAYYTGRKNLRKILMRADEEITLIDNFLHPEILMVVEPYLDRVRKLKFLTRKKKNGNFNSFVSDIHVFKKQYSGFQIEARYNDKCHDRFIIIDDSIVFHSGHSFHELGKKGSRISIMEDDKQIKNFWNDFSDWWDTGKII